MGRLPKDIRHYLIIVASDIRFLVTNRDAYLRPIVLGLVGSSGRKP